MTRVSRLEWGTSIAITVWIIALQFIFALRAGPLWRDEASSVNFANVPTVSEMWSNFRFDNFPPLYAFLLRGFGALGGSSDLSYRMLGVIASLLVLGAIWVSVWLVTKRPPLIALMLFALNPLTIRTDGSIRPYGLGYAFLILAIALIFSYVLKPRRSLFVLAAIVAALSVQTLYQSAFFLTAAILGICLPLLAKRQMRLAGATILIGAIAACTLLIDLPHLLHDWGKAGWVGQSSFAISKVDIDWTALAHAFWRAASNMGNAGAILWCIIVGSLLVLSIRVVMVQRDRIGGSSLIALISGSLIYLCFLRSSGLHAQSWYFLILFAVAALFLSFIANSINDKAVRNSFLAAALLLTVISAPAALESVRTRASSLDVIAQTLKEKSTSKDMVVTMPWYYGITLGRYYDRSKITTVPPMRDFTIHRYDLVQQAMESTDPIGGLLHDMEQTLRNGGTVWTVGEIILPDDNQPVPVLPPYHVGSEYNDSDYLTSWSMQMAVFLATHARKVDVVQLPGIGPVSSLENPKLLAMSGWRD